LTDSTLSTFTASDGDNIALQEWAPLDPARLRGAVVLVHGLGEHAGRYDHVAQFLVRGGFGVRGYDQYGHGESAGVRGGLPGADRLLADLADVIESTRVRLTGGQPLIVLGHSMGGLVAARLVAMHPGLVDGLVLSSPALDAGLSGFQKLLLSVVPRIAPNLAMGNGLDANYLSHDPAVVAAYKADPLVHDRISGKLARFISDAGAATMARAMQWKVPTLLMYAGADRLVNPAGSRTFAAMAPRGVVTSQCFDGLYHELFNETEPGRSEVFALLQDWLNARFP